jgi:hypothetical protein
MVVAIHSWKSGTHAHEICSIGQQNAHPKGSSVVEMFWIMYRHLIRFLFQRSTSGAVDLLIILERVAYPPEVAYAQMDETWERDAHLMIDHSALKSTVSLTLRSSRFFPIRGPSA